jgi:hypothetical protein
MSADTKIEEEFLRCKATHTLKAVAAAQAEARQDVGMWQMQQQREPSGAAQRRKRQKRSRLRALATVEYRGLACEVNISMHFNFRSTIDVYSQFTRMNEATN